MSNPPSIPPRPARAQNHSAPAPASSLDLPKIPPRPKGRIERSPSPHRFDRSPLNDPTYAHGGPPKDNRRLSTEVPSRPPSVSLPTLGQEGSEYASFEDLSKTLTSESHGSVQQSAVASDLPLHAPTASVPGSTAKRNIQAVTRTDSNQAAAAGFGKLAPEDKAAQGAKTGRSGSSIGSRPASIYNDKEHQGIPEIGVQVPMFRNAGDVQAPTPNPYEQQGSSTGVGFHNKPSARHHGRTKSGREIFHGPPGSYGMHGHGKISNDDFEKKWYEKHPDDLKREKAGEYGPHIQENRKDYHWRADDLGKLVHGAPRDIGFGTSREAISTPDEQIGYRATEEYASRMASPRPSSSASRPTSKAANQESSLRHEAGAESEQLDDNGDVIHIDPPAHRTSKVHGGGYDPPTEDLGPQGGNTDEKGGWVTERGYGIPILASDEVQKHPDAEWRQPAVSPEMERRHDGEYTVNEDGTPAYLTKQRTHSRSSSRNNNLQQHRAIPSPANFGDRTGTPLESHKEYEPLFPEDEEDGQKPKTLADKVKRPNLARHHFPSQDVWEDAPGSLQLETTVDTPQAPEEPETPAGADVSAAKVFEPPETEEKRKDNITKEDQQSFLPEHTKQFAAENKHLRGVRPSTQRFPSQDIWEDAPEHGHLETTVSGPQTPDTNEYAPESPIVEKPTVPARPSVPARPQKAQQESSPIDKKAPIIPDRPKPQVPARPSKPSQPSSESVPTVERTVENDAPQSKAKPPVPARPAGSKIAALQAGFLQDLNSKLGLGPQAPKVKEPEEEKEAEPAQPLSDARKGRAKGPQRRKPAASPTPAATVTAEVAVPRAKLDIAPVTAIWSFVEDGSLDVPAARIAAQIQHSLDSHKSAATEPEDKEQSEAPGSPEATDIPASTEAPKAAEAPVADTIKSVAAPVVDAAKSVVPAESSPQSGTPAKDEPSLLTKISEALPSLQSTEDSVKSAPGSSEAPGAFPELDEQGEAGVEKTSDPLHEVESLPSTKSQGDEVVPTAMRETVSDA